MFRKLFTIGIILVCTHLQSVVAQDSLSYTLMLRFPVFDYPENSQSNYRYPTMQQALDWSSSMYDLSYWGIHETSFWLVKNKNNTAGGEFTRKGVEYLLGLAFAKYGSELPIPLGVWGHEAYHGSVLGAAGYSPLNGNSLFHRWDGTVYGITDEELSDLKQENLSQLLYSCVAGVQYEIQSTKTNVTNDFYNKRKFYKAPLYLYNAWYVFNYFRFSTSAASDSVKILAPPHENTDPFYRDYAGADLTAWVYDMFSPEEQYTGRDGFPNGQGINRRIGFSDLTADGQDFLNKQKKLALLNFLNPAIFFINPIKIGNNFSFLPFAQYAPTHFGNSISANIPFTVKETNHMLVVNNFNNKNNKFWGFEYDIYGINLGRSKRLVIDLQAEVWQQPANQNFYDETSKTGLAVAVGAQYALTRNLAYFLKTAYKTEGLKMGNPYLKPTFSFSTGISFHTYNE